MDMSTLHKIKPCLAIALAVAALGACTRSGRQFEVEKQLDYCAAQVERTISEIGYADQMPRNILDSQTAWNLVPVDICEWTVGFWPGILWYNYEHTGSAKDRETARHYTALLEPLTGLPAYDHDLGFQLFCSYGNGYRLTGDPAYKKVLIDAANTLATLYNPTVGTILSWPREVEPNNWPHNTIMDNMINLEMLYWAARNGGGEHLYEIATKHAETTMKNSFREDGGNYHVTVYDTLTGNFIKGVTHQGYADSTLWARGQAWAIYGYTVVYRETGDKKFLRFAEKVADLYLDRLPEGRYVPYWDFDAPNIPDEPKDASAAAIVASALLELSQLEDDPARAEKYRDDARSMLVELSTPEFLGGKLKPSFLVHSTGHWPKGSEVDAAINYADYYYIEALTRYYKAERGMRLAEDSARKRYDAFYPGEIWEDNNGVHINAHGGGMLFHDGRYWWFGEHKTEGTEGNTAQVGVHCYSSTDLYNWTDEGIALHVSDDPESLIVRGCILERPKVIHNERTGKFVMWFHLEPKGMGYGGAMSGVAVADHITGPYTFLRAGRVNPGHYPENVLPLHKQPVRQEVLDRNLFGGNLEGEHPDSLNILGRDVKTGQMARDMTLFVDDDGKAYHIYSSESNSTLHIAELSDDYLSHTGRYVRVFINRYMEASALFKKEGKYYYIGSGCTGWQPNAARSAVAPSIWGPWTELGNPCVGDKTETTYDSQSTYILPVQGKPGTLLYLGDRWRPDNAIDGRYIWLPVTFEQDRPVIRWHDQWRIES